jgi:hypothetical protein
MAQFIVESFGFFFFCLVKKKKKQGRGNYEVVGWVGGEDGYEEIGLVTHAHV